MADAGKSHISDEEIRKLFPRDAWARVVDTKETDTLPIEDELDYLYAEVRHTQWMVAALAAATALAIIGGWLRGRNSHA